MSLSHEPGPPFEPRSDRPRTDPDHAADRTAEALDRLVRGASSGTRPWSLGPGALATLRRPAVGLIAVAVVIAAVLVVTQRRPPAVDDRLPRAVATSTTAPADATSPPPAAGASSTVAPDARIVVHVAGAVSTPGVVELPASSRVVDAVHAAGGLRADADPDRVNLAAPLADGHRVVIPVVGQPAPTELVAPAPSGGTSGGVGDPGAGGAGGGDAAGLIDLNSADASALDELPGVGPSTAAAILAHREKEGPFTSVDGLLDVRGIGEAKLEALRDLVTVGG